MRSVPETSTARRPYDRFPPLFFVLHDGVETFILPFRTTPSRIDGKLRADVLALSPSLFPKKLTLPCWCPTWPFRPFRSSLFGIFLIVFHFLPSIRHIIGSGYVLSWPLYILTFPRLFSPPFTLSFLCFCVTPVEFPTGCAPFGPLHPPLFLKFKTFQLFFFL